jgi:hypothetical protein
MRTGATNAALPSRWRAMMQPKIASLILVCGPSSVGKSSFIRQLQAGALMPELQEKFPRDVKGWRRVEEKNRDVLSPNGSLLPRRRPPRLNVILHYDTTYIFEQGCGGYEDDRHLDVLFAADEVLVVDIRASREALERSAADRKARAKRRHVLGRFLKVAKRTFRGHRPGSVVRDRFPRLQAYREEGWLERFYGRWQAFLDDVPGRLAVPVRIVRVEAIVRPVAEPTFRLLGS